MGNKPKIQSFQDYALSDRKSTAVVFIESSLPSNGTQKLIEDAKNTFPTGNYHVFLLRGPSQEASSKLDEETRLKIFRRALEGHGRNISLAEGTARQIVQGLREDHSFVKIFRESESNGVDNAIMENRYADFVSLFPLPNDDKRNAQKTYNQIREAMGLEKADHFRSHIQLPSLSETRELYVQGKIFQPGEIVKDAHLDQVIEIEECKSNFVVDTKGKKHFIENLEPCETANNKMIMKESSLSRIYQWISNHDYGTISAFRSARDCNKGVPYTRRENMQRNKSLKSKLRSMGYGVTSIDGSYIEDYKSDEEEKEVSENSFLVVDINDKGTLKDDLFEMGEFYEQDSILFGRAGKPAELIGTNRCPDGYPGYKNLVRLGKGVFGKRGEFFSQIGGRPFVFESTKESKEGLETMPRFPTEIRSVRKLAEMDWKDIPLTEEEETYKPPAGAKSAAKKALKWKEEHGDEVKAMTQTGWTRANQLAKGENLSYDTVKRMAAFARHKKNAKVSPEHKDEPWKDNGHVAWLGWGGDAGVEWAQKIVDGKDKD